MGISIYEYQTMLSRLDHNALRDLRDQKSSPGVERECVLQNQVLAECARRGWLVVYSRPDRATTTRIGSPAFLMLSDGGRTFAGECKARPGKLTLEKKSFLARAHKLGNKAAFSRSLSSFLEFVK